MLKRALPMLLGLGLLAGGTLAAQAQPYPYPYPYGYNYTYPYYYAGNYPYYYPGSTSPICPNTVLSNGYGSPHYYPYCGIESQSPGNLPDPYSWYRPYSSNVGPKPST